MQPHGFVRNVVLVLCAAAPWSAAGHTVLVEGGSASSCPHCAVASAEMYALHASGAYDVCYLVYVADRNAGTSGRMDELGVTSIPHYVFDGGFETWIGSGELPQAYATRIEKCAARTVPDLALDVRAVWEGDALVSCTLGVANRSGAAYAGRLRACIVERVSRWKTTSGDPFHFAMIDAFVVNHDITVPAGEARESSAVWDGVLGGYADVTRDNLAVIAFVADATTGYVDAVLEAAVGSGDPTFRRGDANTDGVVNIADAVFVLAHLFAHGAVPPCRDAADANDDGTVNIADAIRVLGHLFGGTGPLPEPFAACGADTTQDGLECAAFRPCNAR